MSLLGRLEDLSLTDIVQIVFLSRRTGMLEIIDSHGRYTVLFQHGLIVNATSPASPDLGSYFENEELFSPDVLSMLRKTEDAGVPIGTAVLEMNLMDAEGLGKAIHQRISEVVVPLLSSRDGEFNFILSDSIGLNDIEYDAATVFREGGIPPQKIISAGDGEKLKPLKGLEESMKAGKALLRGATSAPAPTPALELAGSRPAHVSPAAPLPPPSAAPSAPEPVSPGAFPEPVEKDPFDLGADDAEGTSLDLPGSGVMPSQPPAPTAPTGEDEGQAAASHEAAQRAIGRFKIDASAAPMQSRDRNVILFERTAMLRVAAKRLFVKRGMKVSLYGSMEETRKAVMELLAQNQFFITFIDLAGMTEQSDGDSAMLLAVLKKKNHLLPVVVIDREADLRRRARVLKLGADHYLTKPSEAHLQPALAEEHLGMFAEELVGFSVRAFLSFDERTSGYDGEGGKRLYDLAEQEKVDRSFDVLKQLINELSNPNDIGEVTLTILRLAGEYLDRAVLFVGSNRFFVGLSGIGVTGDATEMEDRVKATRISYSDPSVLAEVASSGERHQGKIRRTPANVQLIQQLGKILPTEIVVLPISHRGRVVGLLYGDNGMQHEPVGDLSGLELFLSQAGFAFENAVIAAAKRGDNAWA